MSFNFVQTEVTSQATGFTGNEFTEPLKGLPVRAKGETGKSLSFVVAYNTKQEQDKASDYLTAIARNSTDEFSVAKRLHKNHTLNGEGVRVPEKGSAVIEFWKAAKITRKRNGSETVEEPESVSEDTSEAPVEAPAEDAPKPVAQSRSRR